jgi:hypothetical protein
MAPGGSNKKIIIALCIVVIVTIEVKTGFTLNHNVKLTMETSFAIAHNRREVKTVVPGECAEVRCCLETMPRNETVSALSRYTYPNPSITNGTSLCILYSNTTHAKCPTEEMSTAAFLNELRDTGNFYNTFLNGCQVRSILLNSFTRSSIIHFEGDSIMRQLWTRLICMARDQGSCVDVAFKSCAFYSFNSTGGDRFDLAGMWHDPISYMHRGSDITLSYCFTTSPSLNVAETNVSERIQLYVFGLFYWDAVGHFEQWIRSHGEDNLKARLTNLKSVMFVERIPSRWKYPTETNKQVFDFMKNATSQSETRIGLVPWNRSIATHRPESLEPVDPLHWMCRWRAEESLTHGPLLDCVDREMQAVVLSFLSELLRLNI